MASGAIKNTGIFQKTINIGGIEVTRKGTEWYYADLNITSQLPSGARIIAVTRGGNWTENCVIDGVTINNSSNIHISCPFSQILPSGRTAEVMYTLY